MLFSTRRTRTTLIGHAVATRAATDVILRVRAGLAEPSRPISAMLFTGPTGTGADLPFTANAVRWVCYGHAIISYDARRRAAGRLTAAQIAPLLGISESIAKAWARQGRLLGARSGRRPTWMFEPLADQPESIQQLAVTPRRPRRGPTSATIAADLRGRIDRPLGDHDDSEIAAQLNAEAVLTGSGAPLHASGRPPHSSAVPPPDACGS